jgi:hypothetical protein
MVIEWRPSPERLDRMREFVGMKGRQDPISRREVKRRLDVPGSALGKALGEIGQPETCITVVRTIAND